MINKKELYQWCTVPREELMNHSDRKVPLRIVKDAEELGEVMARDFVEDIKQANKKTGIITQSFPVDRRSGTVHLYGW